MRAFFLTIWILLLAMGATAQRARTVAPAKPQTAIFAVLDNGKFIEPIAKLEKGKLAAFGEGGEFPQALYFARASYNLIFGGVNDGKVTVHKSLIGTECAGNTAEVTVAATKAKLSTFVMGLATNLPYKPELAFFRRLPTAAERSEIEALVKAEFKKNGVASTAAEKIHYHNLTAIDVNGDKTAELVGTFWSEPARDDRRLLFFVAEKGSDGGYSFNHKNYSALKTADIMSGDTKDVDEGILHEMLIDSMDIDGDGTAEIFTTKQAFEGRNFHVYRKSGYKWTSILESYNYRCGY
jgi:hypothetical protein